MEWITVNFVSFYQIHYKFVRRMQVVEMDVIALAVEIRDEQWSHFQITDDKNSIPRNTNHTHAQRTPRPVLIDLIDFGFHALCTSQRMYSRSLDAEWCTTMPMTEIHSYDPQGAADVRCIFHNVVVSIHQYIAFGHMTGSWLRPLRKQRSEDHLEQITNLFDYEISSHKLPIKFRAVKILVFQEEKP